MKDAAVAVNVAVSPVDVAGNEILPVPFPSGRARTDSALIQKAKLGNPAALEEIFRKYSRKIFTVAFKYLHNQPDASDMVQETFINAFKFFYKFQAKSELSTWLTRICLNLCWHKKKRDEGIRRFEVTLDGGIDSGGNRAGIQFADGRLMPPEEIEKEQEKKKILTAVDSLKKKYREIVVLRDLEGYSYEDIQKILNVSQGTVMSRLHRARKILAKNLHL